MKTFRPTKPSELPKDKTTSMRISRHNLELLKFSKVSITKLFDDWLDRNFEVELVNGQYISLPKPLQSREL